MLSSLEEESSCLPEPATYSFPSTAEESLRQCPRLWAHCSASLHLSGNISDKVSHGGGSVQQRVVDVLCFLEKSQDLCKGSYACPDLRSPFVNGDF